MVSRADIAEHFLNFGIETGDEVLEKCWEICADAGVEAEDFVETWMAYSVSHFGSADPTVEMVTQMERDEYGKKNASQMRNRTPSTPGNGNMMRKSLVVYESNNSSASSSAVIESDILEGYYATPKGSKSEKKRLQSPPHEENQPPSKRSTPARHSLNFSPVSFSAATDGLMGGWLKRPIKSNRENRDFFVATYRLQLILEDSIEKQFYRTTRSAVYLERGNSGQVLCSYGIQDKEEWVWSKDEGEGFNPSLKVIPLVKAEKPSFWRYMCTWMSSRAELLDLHIQRMGKWLNEHLEPWEPVPLDKGSTNLQNYLGRISTEGNGRLNIESVLLEGTIDSTTEGYPIRLDLSKMLGKDGIPDNSQEPYAFFPGQVVVVNGTNNRGKRLLAHKIHSYATAPLPPNPPSLSIETGPLRVVIGAGPFTQMDNMTYQPLEDLMKYVCLHRPHVLILVGPFLDCSHTQISGEEGCVLAETFEIYFERMVDGLMQSLEGINVKVVLVASARDVVGCPVFPTHPYTFPSGSHVEKYLNSQQPKLLVAPDPCFLDINGVITGVTSTDILMHLSREEYASSGNKLNRVARLCTHLINQRNFYPLYPSALGVNMDLKFWSDMSVMPFTPHLLVLPSDLRYFIKNIEGCLVINPEHLTKGVAGGSFVQFEVQPSSEFGLSICGNIKAQVLKI